MKIGPNASKTKKQENKKGKDNDMDLAERAKIKQEIARQTGGSKTAVRGI